MPFYVYCIIYIFILNINIIPLYLQLLARPYEVERFFPDQKDAKTVAALRNTYAGLWGVDETNERDKPIIEVNIIKNFRLDLDFDLKAIFLFSLYVQVGKPISYF